MYPHISSADNGTAHGNKWYCDTISAVQLPPEVVKTTFISQVLNSVLLCTKKKPCVFGHILFLQLSMICRTRRKLFSSLVQTIYPCIHPSIHPPGWIFPVTNPNVSNNKLHPDLIHSPNGKLKIIPAGY